MNNHGVKAGSQIPSFFRLSASLRGLLTSTGVIACAASVAGFCGAFGWFPDLFSHFRTQYFLGLVALAVILLALGQKRTSAIFALFAVANLATIVPLYFGQDQPGVSGQPTFRAMLMNVNTRSGRPDLVRTAISNAGPDILVLEEINPMWLDQLAGTLKSYPHFLAEPRDDNFGIGLFSKRPLLSAEVVYFADAEVPSIVAVVDMNGTNMHVVATHPPPPAGGEYSGYRNRQLFAIAGKVAKIKGPLLLLGDLNVSPWNLHFARLLGESGLRDSARGRGVHPTWPTYNPLLRIPIDHCLCSPDIVVVARRVGPYVGSDHYPVIVDARLGRRQ